MIKNIGYALFLFLNLAPIFWAHKLKAQAGIQVTYLEDFTNPFQLPNPRWELADGLVTIPTSLISNGTSSNIWVANNTVTPTINNTDNLHISCLAGDCGNTPGQNNLVVFNATNGTHASNKVVRMTGNFLPQAFNGNNLKIEFDWIFQKTNPASLDAGMRMIYSINDGTTWREINQTYLGNLNPGIQTTSFELNATNFPGFNPSIPKLRIGFRWFNKAPAQTPNPTIDSGILIDNLRIRNYPTLILNSISPAIICTGDSATVVFQNGGFPPTETFTLQISDATGSFAANQILGNLPKPTSKVLIPLSLIGSANYKVRIESTSLFFSNALPLNVIASPVKPFAGGDITECSGKTIPIGGGAAEPGVIYSWNDAALGANLAPNIILANTGTSFTKQTYILTGTRSFCNAKDTVILTINPNPIVDAGLPLSVCEGDLPILLVALPATTPAIATPSGNGIWTGTGITGSGNQTFFNPSGLVGTQTLTYTYSQDWKNGGPTCEAKDTRVITVKAAPIVQAGDPLTFCNGIDSVLITGFNPTFPTGNWSGTGISAKGMFFPKSLTIGTYICTLSTTNAGGCSTFATRQLKVTPAPVINAGVFNQFLCSKLGSYQMTGFTPPISAETKWTSPTPSLISIGGALSFNDSRAGIHKLKYTYDKDQCKVSDSVSMTIIKSPKVVFARPKDSICESSPPIILSGVSPGGGSWRGPGITNNNFNPSGLSGSQEVWYRALSPEGNCIDSASKIIFVKDSPQAFAGDSVQSICGNLPSYQMVGFSPTEGNFGKWTSDTILKISPLGKIDSIFKKAGRTYLLKYTFTKLGCTSIDSVSLSISSVPKIIIGANQNVCANDPSFPLQNVTPTGGKWKGPGVDTLGVRFTPSTSLVGTQKVWYKLSIDGCPDSAFRIIVVKSAPIVNAGKDDSICFGRDSLILTNYSPSTGIWTGEGVDSNGVFRPKKFNRIGNVPLVYTVKFANGCQSKDEKQIVIFQIPSAASGIDTASCTDEGVKIGGPPLPNLVYKWFEPVPNTISKDTLSDPILTIKNTKQTPDTFKVRLFVRDTISGCFKSDTTKVIIYPRPEAVVAFPFPKSKCAGDTFVIKAKTKPGLLYEWLRNGLSLNIPSSKDSVLRTGLSGKYSLIVRNIGAFCTDVSESDSLTIFKRFLPRIAGNKLFCKDSTTQVKVSPITQGFSYQWQYNSVNVPDSIGTTFTIGRTGTIRVILKTDKGCEDSSLVTLIDSLPFPKIPFLNDTSICENGIATFRVPKDSLYNYRWLDSSNNSIVSTRDTFKTAKPGKYYVEVYNFCRTVKDSSKLIRINPLPRFNILRNGDTDTTVCKGLKVSAFGPIGYLGYEWTLDDSLKTSGRQLNINTDETGRTKLALKVTDEFGCSNGDTATITVVECTPVIYVPTAFSPQGDRQNDIWKIEKYNISEFKVVVYNRWGEMVYYSDKKGEKEVQSDQGWDGKFKGGTCPSGAYKWLVDYKGTQDGIEIVRRDTGTVTIIR